MSASLIRFLEVVVADVMNDGPGDDMDVVYHRVAGLDVHKKTVVACRLVRGSDGQARHETKTFSTVTESLLELSDWLAETDTTHVAMESTGEYWKPVYNILEGNFQLLLVNAHHLKMVPGRKTDVGDARWIARLLQFGLLKASFVPPASQRALRELTRHRSTFIRQRAMLANRIQKVLEGCNIKLASVASDVLGASGKAMLRAIVEGETNPTTLAELAKGRLRDKNQALQQALFGRIEGHHRLALRELLRQVDSLDESIAQFTVAIEDMCRQDGSSNGKGGSEPQSASAPQDQLENHAPLRPDTENRTDSPSLPPIPFDAAVALLTTIPGVGKNTAEMVVSEIGTNMERFPSANHLSAWGGVAPANNTSGGKILNGTTRQGNKALKAGLVQAAHAAARTKATFLSAQFKRVAKRRGGKRAAMAVAHSLLIIIYHMLRRHQPYRELGEDYYDKLKPEAKVDKLVRQIAKLGYNTTLSPSTATA